MILQIFYYFLSIVGIVKKRSILLTPIMLLIMWCVFGLCTYNGDYENYRFIYNNIQNPIYWLEFEPFFNIIMYFCSKLGLSFIQFRMIYGAFFLILLHYAIGKYTENKSQVLGFVMIFPYIYFTSVIRSGLACVFILLAYNEIMGGKQKKIKFWIYFIIAILFHYTSIFFILYYIFRKMKGNKVFFVVGLVFVAIILYKSGILLYIMKYITDNERILKWYAPEKSSQQTRWVLYLIIIDLLVVFLAYLSKKNNKYLNHFQYIANPYAKDIYYFNIIMLILIPAFFVTNASGRLIWEILLFNIICYAKDDEIRFHDNNMIAIRYYKKDVLLTLFLILFAIYANLPYRGTRNDMNKIFYNNIITKGFF